MNVLIYQGLESEDVVLCGYWVKSQFKVFLELDCNGKKPNIMARHNVIYIEALCARDIPLGLACTGHGFDTSISLANQV